MNVMNQKLPKQTQRAVAEANRIRNEQLRAERAEIETVKAERDLARPPFPPKRRQPKVTRHMSRDQRTVTGQSNNPVKAIYTDESKYNRTPIIPDGDDRTLTRDVGPGDQYNNTNNYRTGKATNTATGEGNKRSRPYNRANGGGRNKPGKVDYDALADKFLENLF